jgi:hypothetical protein
MSTFNNASSIYHNNKEVSSIVDLGNNKVIWEKSGLSTSTSIVEPVIFNVDFNNVEEDIIDNGCGVIFCFNENGTLLSDYTEEEYQSLLNTEREEYEDGITSSLWDLGGFYSYNFDLEDRSFYLQEGEGGIGTIEDNGVATIEIDLETMYAGAVIFVMYDDQINETRIFPQHTVTHDENNTIVNVVI